VLGDRLGLSAGGDFVVIVMALMDGRMDCRPTTVISEVGPTPEYSFKLLSGRGKEGGGGNNGTGEK